MLLDVISLRTDLLASDSDNSNEQKEFTHPGQTGSLRMSGMDTQPVLILITNWTHGLHTRTFSTHSAAVLAKQSSGRLSIQRDVRQHWMSKLMR